MLPIMLVTIAYIIGSIWGLYLNFNLGIAFFCLFICFGIILKQKIIYILIVVSILSMGYTTYRKYKFENTYINGRIEVTAKIISDIEEKEYYDIYIIKNENNNKFILKVKKGSQKLEYGTKIKLYGDFELPEKARNMGGFNYRFYLNSNNIYGTIKTEQSNIKIISIHKFNIIHDIRNKIKNTFIKIFPEDHAGILTAMTIGDTSLLKEDIEESFRDSGIIHIIAISGSHLVYIIFFMKFISNKLFGKRYSIYITILSVIIFMIVAEASPSLIRSCIMALTILLSEIISRKSNIYANISISILIILLYNPYIILNIGFLLSYGSVLGILLFMKTIEEKLKYFTKHIRIRR